MTHQEYQQAEVDWYRANGRYRDRVRTDSSGRMYVVGDEDWNRRHPQQQEWVEAHMSAELAKLRQQLCTQRRARHG